MGTARRSRITLTVRLAAAFTLVVAIGGFTAYVVAAAIGPSRFDDHLARAGFLPDSDAVAHARAAFTSASGQSLALGLAAAAVASVAVAVFVARRISRALRAFADATSRVARGEYATVGSSFAAGSEFDSLANDFNLMASELDQAESLRRRLVSDVAHELRTPVATIVGYLDGIDDGVRKLDDATLQVMRAAATRLARLADDLSDVTLAEAGPSALRVHVVSAADVTAAAVAAARPAFDSKGVALAVRAEDEAWISADPERLGQVLGNLLDNALRHTARGGHVTVVSQIEAVDVMVSVSDDGEGIPPEDLSRVFDRFYRVDTARDRERGGSGIGLAIASGIVRAHGGRIEAFSDGPGSGARLVIALPRRAQPRGRPTS